MTYRVTPRISRWISYPLAAGIVVLIALTFLTGCGSERPERADTIEGPSEKTTTAAAPVEADKPGLTQTQVEAALLDVADLPSGWSVDTSEEESDGEDVVSPPECADLFAELDEQADVVAKAEIDFTAGGFGPFLGHGVSVFDSPAADLVERTADTMNECSEFTSTDKDGVATTFTASALSFPNIGDRTMAVRLQGSADGFDLVVDVIMIAVGSSGTSLVVGGLTPMPGSELEAVARTAVEKIEEAAKS